MNRERSWLPDDIDQRKKVYHNSSICHCKIYKEEAEKIVDVVCSRLNQAVSPVTLVIPAKGCCEAAAPGGPMYDPEVDEVMVDAFKKKIGNNVKLVIVDANINEKAFSETVAHEVLLLAHE